MFDYSSFNNVYDIKYYVHKKYGYDMKNIKLFSIIGQSLLFDSVNKFDIIEAEGVEEINDFYSIVIPPNTPMLSVEDRLTYDFPKDYLVSIKKDIRGNDVWQPLSMFNYDNIDEIFNLNIEVFKTMYLKMNGEHIKFKINV